MNRLAGASSPYLRQHATNPVHWYPWGEEALDRARERGCPILLSIGYSACHWCHVMERESFDDPETARLMNREFVSVKVDREERPDIDTVYMRAVQALTGHGGWPLTVFLTPEGEPFFGGTYYPPERRHGMPAFREVLAGAAEAWKRRRGDVLGAAARIRGFLVASNVSADGKPPPEGGSPDPGLPARASRRLLAAVDPVHGGIGRAPKFPQPEVLGFLLDRRALAGEEDALAAALLTLRAMARGGIRDQLGGGFHRYAVDERWLVPHFEKMLYDNALLAQVYLRAFQLTGEDWLEEVCRGILDDLLDDFRSPEGGFYTARDADSEGEEGRFYIWTPGEIAALLPEAEARLFSRCYDVSEEGNFEGRNILHLPHDLAGIARSEGIAPDRLEARLRASRAVLKRARSGREAPFRDEKILASWNALAIRAFAEAGAALGEESYVRTAEGGAAWLLAGLSAEGGLRHQISGGKAEVPGFLDDVAGLGNALLSVHEATLGGRWLAAAVHLDLEVEARFREGETGLLHDTPSDGEALLIRPRDVTDNPVPSGTALAAELRMRLGRLLGDPRRIRAAEAIVAREARAMEAAPSAFGRLLSVAGRLAAPPVEIAVVGRRGDPAGGALLREAHRPFLPTRVITGGDPGHPEDDPAGPVPDTPLLEGRRPVDGRPAAFVCVNFACGLPATDPGTLREQLDRMAPDA